MKKVLSFVLALVMVMALSVTAFAETYDGVSKSENQNVTADYQAGKDEVPTVYSFTITWIPAEGNNLTYKGEKATYTWDTTGLRYDKEIEVAAGWSGEAKYTVTVDNNSNAKLSVVTKAASDEIKLDATTSDAEETTVESAAVGLNYKTANTPDSGKTQSATVTYTFKAGTNTTAITDTQSNTTRTVGKINITVDKAA